MHYNRSGSRIGMGFVKLNSVERSCLLITLQLTLFVRNWRKLLLMRATVANKFSMLTKLACGGWWRHLPHWTPVPHAHQTSRWRRTGLFACLPWMHLVHFVCPLLSSTRVQSQGASSTWTWTLCLLSTCHRRSPGWTAAVWCLVHASLCSRGSQVLWGEQSGREGSSPSGQCSFSPIHWHLAICLS